jgi:dTDP-4-dehydrorhamnose 3,5-epimerase
MADKWCLGEISGTWTQQLRVFEDTRGHFIETYRAIKMPFCNVRFKQDSASFSTSRVLRGLHAQEKQWQLATLIAGEVLYFSLDLNRKSATYRKVAKVPLSTKSTNQILGRPGIAHGFYVLSDWAVIHYKSSVFHGVTKEYDINMSNYISDFGITEFIQSRKDQSAPSLETLETQLNFQKFQRSLDK